MARVKTHFHDDINDPVEIMKHNARQGLDLSVGAQQTVTLERLAKRYECAMRFTLESLYDLVETSNVIDPVDIMEIHTYLSHALGVQPTYDTGEDEDA